MPAPQIEVRYAPAQPSLSDLIQMEITLVRAPPDVVLSPVNIAPDCVTMRSVQMAEGRTHLVLGLDLIRPGPCRIPAFHTQCLHSAAPACDVRSAETTITIGTMIPAGITPDIRDKKELPLPIANKAATKATPSDAHFVWLFAACCLGVVIGWWLWRNRRKSPLERAQARLKTAGTFDDLIALFRDYIDRRLNVSTASTSPELTATLLQRDLIEGRSLGTLEHFLATADRARFAGTHVTPEQLEAARTQCAQLLRILNANMERSSRARL